MDTVLLVWRSKETVGTFEPPERYLDWIAMEVA